MSKPVRVGRRPSFPVSTSHYQTITNSFVLGGYTVLVTVTVNGGKPVVTHAIYQNFESKERD